MSDYSTKKDPIGEDRGWLLPEGKKQHMKPGLYLVATPIGNLSDITLRALDVLSMADVIACEDTRVSGKLLSHYGMKKPLMVYNDHSDQAQRSKILGKINEGQIVALISDAGTPLVSDPGYKLVRECLDSGLHVTSLPGANAPLSALQLSGLPSDAFCFLGFLPSKQGARQKLLQKWAGVDAALIAFESGGRLLKALEDIAEVLGARQVVVARELTKLHEDLKTGTAAELLALYDGPPKGEIVLVIAPGDAAVLSEDEVDILLKEALKDNGTKEAAAHVAAQTGLSKKDLYQRALGLSKHEPE